MAARPAFARLLEDRGITQAELARRIGSPRSTVSMIAKGHPKGPTLRTARAIAEVLEMSLDDLAVYLLDDGWEVDNGDPQARRRAL